MLGLVVPRAQNVNSRWEGGRGRVAAVQGCSLLLGLWAGMLGKHSTLWHQAEHVFALLWVVIAAGEAL